MSEWLADDAPELALTPVASVDNCQHGKPTDREQRYAASALERECAEVANTGKGERNNRLNIAALKMGGFVTGGLLSESDATAALLAAAKTSGLGERESKLTIRSGMQAGKKEPRHAPAPTPRASNGNGHSNGHHQDLDIGEPPEWMNDGEPEQKPTTPRPNPFQARSIADVLDGWCTDGPLIHEPTGIKSLDELTGGGPVYGTRWYVAGAPDAGKTALLVQIAQIMAQRGVAVGLLAVDEEPGDLVTRLAQRLGYMRVDCEVRARDTLDAIRTAIGTLPIRFYDDRWSIESAAHDLAEFAKVRATADPHAHPHGPRALLGIDSLQTVRCDREELADRELSEVAAVTARVRAIRAVGTAHKFITMTTSELGRGAYRSSDPEQQTSTMASAKWSGAVEYSARVLIGLRSVAGETDLLDLELAKNKHGPRDEHVFLRIDRRSQSLWQVEHEPPPSAGPGDRAATAKERVIADAAIVARVLSERPGIGLREIRGAARAAGGLGHDRVDAALAALGGAVVRGTGPRGARPMTLDGEGVPESIKTMMEAADE